MNTLNIAHILATSQKPVPIRVSVSELKYYLQIYIQVIGVGSA